MNKPNPVPLYDFDANFVNNLGNIAESIPCPESFTQTNACLNYYPLYSGQALRMLKRDQSAEEVINEIMREAKEYLSSIDFD